MDCPWLGSRQSAATLEPREREGWSHLAGGTGAYGGSIVKADTESYF